MDKMIIKVGVNPMKDMKEMWENPSKNKSGKYYTYVGDVSDLQNLLSSERLRLIISLLKESTDVSTTAKKLKRKQEAISRDASILETAGIITKTKKGRQTFLKTKIKKIEIDFS